jgi:hypothetical protein
VIVARWQGLVNSGADRVIGVPIASVIRLSAAPSCRTLFPIDQHQHRRIAMPAELGPTEIGDEALDHLLAHAGLSLTPAQKAELKTVYTAVAAMAERVRRPRGPMAELAHTYGFNDGDL